MTDKEVAILGMAARADGPLRFAEIRQSVKMPETSLSRLLANLVAKGVLQRTGRGTFVRGPLLDVPRRTELFMAGPAPLTGQNVLLMGRWRGLFDGGLRDGIRDVLEPLGARCVFAGVGSWEMEFDAFLKSTGHEACDGLILCARNRVPRKVAENLRKWGKPIVQVDTMQHLPYDTVSIDDYASYFELTEILIERGARLIIVPREIFDELPANLEAQYHGAVAAAARHSVQLKFIDHHFGPENQTAAVNELAEFIMERSRKPQTVGVVFPGFMYQAAYQIPLIFLLQERKAAFHRDVLIASVFMKLDSSHQIPIVQARITCHYLRDEFQLGAAAARRLVERMQGDTSPPVAHRLQMPIIVNPEVPPAPSRMLAKKEEETK